MEFVHQVIALIATHKEWAGLVIGAFAFGESLVLLGVLVPGTAVLVVVGGLIGAGVIDPWPVVIGAAVGAALGDAISYYLGVWIGGEALTRWPLNRYETAVARTRFFFRRYGFATVFLGRFFGPIRATVPLVAGIMGMPARRFQVANVLSAMLWAPAILSPGWLLARSWRRFIRWTEADWFTPAVLAALAAVAVAALGFRLYLRYKARPGAAPPTVGI
jgi:membrane protein DedA with SNARE-associated domain